VYLLKHNNCRIKMGYKVSIFVRLWTLLEKLSHSSTAPILGKESGNDVVVMFGFTENVTQ